MAVRISFRKRTREDSLGMIKYFHDSIDGLDVDVDPVYFVGLLQSRFGIRCVNSPRCITDDAYTPESEIEKRLHELFPDGGYNSPDDVFTIERDGFQSMVFIHAGQLFVSDWILDRENGGELRAFSRYAREHVPELVINRGGASLKL